MAMVAETIGNGSMKAQYNYSPFGATQVIGEASDNPFQYTGRENDGTGLYYYRARYYSPEMGRFISEDPIGLLGGINFFAYLGNSPLNFVDPLGLSRAAFDAIFENVTVYDDSGIAVLAVYKASNNTTNPSGNPYIVGSHGPAPGGTYPVQPPVNTGGSVSYGAFFWPIGAVGPKGERADIARQRGIGLHCGRTGHEDPTWGCIRMDDSSCYNLFNLTRDDPLTEITIPR